VQSLHFDLSPCRMNCAEGRASVSPPPAKKGLARFPVTKMESRESVCGLAASAAPYIRPLLTSSPATAQPSLGICPSQILRRFEPSSLSSSREPCGDANQCKTSAKSKGAKVPFAPSAFVMTCSGRKYTLTRFCLMELSVWILATIHSVGHPHVPDSNQLL